MYFDWAETINDGNAHYDIGAGGHGIKTDCHDATHEQFIDYSSAGPTTWGGCHELGYLDRGELSVLIGPALSVAITHCADAGATPGGSAGSGHFRELCSAARGAACRRREMQREIVVTAPRPSDEALTAEVAAALQQDPYIFSEHVPVTTENGVVRVGGWLRDLPRSVRYTETGPPDRGQGAGRERDRVRSRRRRRELT